MLYSRQRTDHPSEILFCHLSKRLLKASFFRLSKAKPAASSFVKRETCDPVSEEALWLIERSAPVKELEEVSHAA